MSKDTTNPRIRRITIALGREMPDAMVLEAIIRLAARAHAEVAGLFVEDINLFRLAELPFALEYCRLTRVSQPLQAAVVERQMRIQAATAQRALATAAERAGIKWSFRTTRGSVSTQLLLAVTEVDLLVLGAAPDLLLHVHEGVLRSGVHRAREVLRARESAPGRPIMVAYDPSTSAQRALQVAAPLARDDGRPLLVLIMAETEEDAERLRQQAVERLGEQTAYFQRLIQPSLTNLLKTVRSGDAAALVIGASDPVLELRAFNMLREGLRCPAFLVR